MIVLLIFTIIVGAIFTVMNASRASWYSGNVQVDVQQETRKAMDSIIKELRQSSQTTISGVPNDGNLYSSISFRIPSDIDNDGDVINASGNIEWGSQITYSLGGLNNEQVLRASGGSTTVLANDIINLQFRRAVSSPNIVEITLQAQKNTVQGRTMQSTLVSNVNLRN